MTATLTAPHFTPPATLPELRPARFDDYAQIQALEASQGLATLSPESWRRIWTDSPLSERCRDREIGWVLQRPDGRIVGSVGNIPFLYHYQGQQLLSFTGRAWVTEPEFRGVALWLMDEYFNQDGADLFINTTVNGQAHDAFNSFGSARVPVGDWEQAALRITHYRGFARAALTIKNAPAPGVLALPVGAALRVKDALTAASISRPDVSFDLTATEIFDERFDGFWPELLRRRADVLLARRDRQTLAWHFAGSLRAGELLILTAARNRLLRAYAIFKRQDHAPSGLRRLRLIDFQSIESTDLLPAFFAAATEQARRAGVHVVEQVGCHLPGRSAIDHLAPYRRTLPAWPYYYKAAAPELAGALAQAQAWRPSSYDGDAALG